jgi:putative DNA primase/helicase
VTSFAELSRRYSEVGWALTPLDGKVPVKRDWQKTAPGEPENIAGRWAEWGKRHGMGVVLRTSGLVVFEYDAEDARERFLELLGGELPATPICRTGRGFLHTYFADPGGLQKAARDGLELRVGEHQCVVPPTLHPDTGEPYEWLEGHEPWLVDCLPVPAAVREFFSRNGRPKTIPAKLTPSTRHESFVTVAAELRKVGVGEAAILASLRALNVEQGDPPKADDAELVALARDAMGWRVGKQPTNGKSPNTYLRSDLGNAELFADRHSDRLRHVKERRLWLTWEAGRWRSDTTGAAERAAKALARERLRAAADVEGEDERKKAVMWAMTSQSDTRIRAALSLATTETPIVLRADDLDRDPFLLACANGTLDLRSGELRRPDPDDLITLGNDVAYDPDATCPRWDRFLEEVFDEDEELIGFVQRLAGYSLSGDVREQIVAVLHGGGNNGKDTLIKPLMRVVGEQAETSPMDTFTRVRDRAVRNDLARLHRARLVIASESAEGRRLDEPTIKLVSGGGRVAARFLYGEFFEFTPQFKVWLITNHRPRVEGDDDAIWRRLRLIPFNVSFLGREDKELDGKLEAELPGILAWAVRGCLEWQRDGLGLPPAVEQATREYRVDEDVLGTFIAERCILEDEIQPAELREAYDAFCSEIGERQLTAAVFGKRLARRGIRREGPNGAYRGITLR